MLPRGRVYRYPPGRALPDVPMPGVAGGMFSVPYDMGGMPPLRDASLSQPIPIGALASALANATPEHQRTVRISFFSPYCLVQEVGWFSLGFSHLSQVRFEVML